MKRKAVRLVKGIEDLICQGRLRGFNPHEEETEGETKSLPKHCQLLQKKKGVIWSS